MPVKYSGADQCFVALYAIEEEIQLVVRDAGAGFDVEEAKRNRGLGLVSMQNASLWFMEDLPSTRGPVREQESLLLCLSLLNSWGG
jgi:signal transduction histidine kinase